MQIFCRLRIHLFLFFTVDSITNKKLFDVKNFQIYMVFIIMYVAFYQDS